jgi:hypothetical protein
MLTVDKTETPPPEEPFYHSNPKYICACGIHVKKGVLYMAGALIVAAILLIIFSLSMAIYSWSIVGIVLIFLCALVIYANRTERENFYLPFLLFAVLFALTTAAFATFLIIMLLQTPHFWQNYASFVFTHTHDAKNEGGERSSLPYIKFDCNAHFRRSHSERHTARSHTHSDGFGCLVFDDHSEGIPLLQGEVHRTASQQSVRQRQQWHKREWRR